MMMNHDELQVANEKQTVIAHVVSSVMLQLRIMKAACVRNARSKMIYSIMGRKMSFAHKLAL